MRAPRVLKPRKSLKPTPLAVSLARFSSAVLMSAAVLSAARGATLYWDADALAVNNTPFGTNLGGTGVWDTATTTNWWGGGVADTSWTSGDTGIFAGTPGVVTTGAGGVTASHLSFQSSGYSLAGTAGVTINVGGILNFSGRALTPVAATISAPIVAASGFRFVGNGGTLTLSGTQTGIGGAITLQSGTISSVTSNTTFGVSLPGLTFRGTSTFQLDNTGEAGAITRDFGALTLLGGDGRLEVLRNAAQNVTVSFTSAPARAAGSTVLFNAPIAGSVAGTNVRYTITGATAGAFLPGYFVSQAGGAATYAIYNATGGVVAPVYGVTSGFQNVSGTASLNVVNQHYQATGALTVTGAASSIGSLSLTSGNTLSINSGVTINMSVAGTGPGSLLKTGGSLAAPSTATIQAASGTATIAGGVAGTPRELIIRAHDEGDTLSLASSIILTGSALTKSGDGTVIISGTNSITGTTYVNGGRLTINGMGALGAASQAVELNGGIYEVLAGINSATAESVATNKSLVVNASSRLTVGRIVANTGGGNKTVQFTTLSIGNSVLTAEPQVPTVNTAPAPYAVQFTGATTLTDALPSTFNVTGTQASGTTAGLTLTGAVGNGGGVTPGIIKTGTGTLVLAGTNTFGGAGSTVEIQGGVLSVNTDASLGNVANILTLNTGTANEGLLSTANITSARGVILAQSTGSLEVASGTILTLNGVVSSNGATGFTKRGAGTLTLGGANTFGGAGSTLDYQAGILDIAAAGALGNVANVKLPATTAGEQFRVSAAAAVNTAANFQLANAAGATVNTINVSNAAGTLSIGGVISSATATSNLTKLGVGNLELANAANTFGGVGTTLDIQAGSLIVSSGGALGDPNNGVRLAMSGATERFLATGTSSARQNFVLANAGGTTTFEVSPSQVFTLNGIVSNTVASDLVKKGTGTLILGNSSTTTPNTFGGPSANKTIDIQAGILGASSNSALGDISNTVRLSGTTLGQGFLATGNFTTGRTFTLVNTTANTIGVVQGNTFTLSAAFNVFGNLNAALLKNDLGNLVLSAVQPTWTGPITVSAGSLRPANATALGTGAGGTTISNLGSLEFTTSLSLAGEAITIAPSADNTVMVGSNNGGVIRAGAGASAAAVITSTSSIGITGVAGAGQSRSVLFGSDLSASLNIQAPIAITNAAATGTFNLLLGGESTGLNLLASAITNTGGPALNLSKIGGGTWNLTAAQSAVNGVTVNAGRFVVSATADGTGAGSGNTFTNAPSLTLTGSGVFAYDNNVNAQPATIAKSLTLGTLALNGGDGRVEIARTAAQNLFLTFGGVTRATGATGLFFAQGNSPTIGTNARFTITGAASGYFNPGTFVVSPLITSATTGFAFYDTGTFTLRPIAYNATGTLDPLAFSYTAGNPILADRYTQITGGGNFNINIALLLRSLHFSSGANPTLSLNSGAFTIDSGVGTSGGALLKTGSGTAATISGLGTIGTVSGREFIVRTDQSGDSLTIDSQIANTTGALTKSGLGTLTLSNAVNAWTGTTYVNAGTLSIQGANALAGSTALNLAGGTLSYGVNGNGFGTPEAVAPVAKDLTINGNSGLIVTRTTANTTALNKTVAFNSLSIGAQTLTVTGQNGYGAQIGGATTLTDAQPANFNIVGTQASNVTSGFTLAGAVSSTNAVGFIKTGSGTLELGSAANTFGGAGAVIDIQNGFVAAGSDGALGNAANGVLLNSTTANQGFRATSTFSTARTFTLAQNTAAFEVTDGSVFTINAPLNIVSTTATLAKNDNGVLELGADNASGWTGSVSINAGAVRLKTGGALGGFVVGASRVTLPTSPGAALQLSGNNVVYTAYPVSLNNTGINNGGALENVSGNNTWTGPITLPNATGATIGAASGSSLLVTGGIAATVVSTPLTLAGAGDITIASALPTTNLSQINKLGPGRLTLSAVNTSFVSPIAVSAGTLAVAGTGARLGGTGAITVNPSATLLVDDSGTALVNRLGSRPVTFNGSTFNLLGNSAANTTETLGSGTTFTRGLTTITVTARAGRSAALSFAGALPNIAPAQNAGTQPNAATVLFRGTNLGSVAGANVATISSVSTSGFTFNGQTGGVGTNNKAILPWALVDTDPVNGVGTSFATADAGNGLIRALNPTEMATSLVSNANVSLGFATTLSARTFNPAALNFNPNLNSLTFQTGGNLSLNTSEGILSLTLTSGGILARGNNVIANVDPLLSNGVLNAPSGNSPLNIWTPGSGSLEIKIALNGGNGATIAGLVKSGAGTLTLSTPLTPIAALSPVYAGLSANSFNSLTAINQGTLRLNGGTNTLFPNNFVHLSPGATLDLNGNSQYVQTLFTDGQVAGAGGTVTSSSGTGTLVLNSDARTFAGSMVGSVNFLRSGLSAGAYTLLAPNTYTGTTQLSGGTTTLRDSGTLANTSSLAVNFSTLLLDNTGTQLVANRVNDGAAVTLRGGNITLAGRPLSTATETLGALTLAGGFSTLTSNVSSGVAPGSNVASADLTFASLTRQTGSLVNFLGQVNGTASTLGVLGSSPRTTFTAAPALAQNLIGAWAIATGAGSVPEFASYQPGLGVGPLGGNGFAAYDPAAILVDGTASQNLRFTGAQAVSANTTVNALNLVGNFTPGITFTSDSTLNLVGGGLIRSGTTAASMIGAAGAGARGKLTSGGITPGLASELVIYQGNSTQNLQIFSNLIDNGAASATTALVLGGTGGTVLLSSQISNTYSGGTTINGITTNTSGSLVTAGVGVVVFPAGGLTINNAAVTANARGNVDPTNVVTINGGGALTLTGANTLAGINFNNLGGTQATPTLNTGGVLTITGAVTATSSNPTTTATLAGRITLNPANPNTFNISPISSNGVNIAPTQAAFILQGADGTGGIAKTGAGVLQFNTQSTYTGLTDVQQGGIQIGAFNGGSRFSTVNLAANTLLNIAGNSTTIGGLSGGGTVTNSSGAGANLTIGFNDASTTFSGSFSRFGDGIAGSLNVVKLGTGKLTLSGNGNTTTGTLTVQIGEVAYTGTGGSTFSNNVLATGGLLTLDNVATNANNRFGGNVTSSTLTMSGGTLRYLGNAGASTTETIDTLTVTNGASTIDLQPNVARELTLNIVTSLSGVSGGGTLFINNLSDTDGAGKATIDGSTLALNAPAGAGTNFPATQNAVRPDIIAFDGVNIGFVTKELISTDPLKKDNIRLLKPSELLGGMASGSATPTNYSFTSGQIIGENTSAYSVVLRNGSSITKSASVSFAKFGPNGSVLSQIVISGGILVPASQSSSITVPLLTTGQNVPLTFHILNGASLNVTADLGAGTAGITKSGTGTLTVNGRGFYSGATTVNEGSLILNGGQDQGIALAPGTASIFFTNVNNVNIPNNGATLSALNVNGGTLNLSGRSQVFGQLGSNNPNPGFAGTVTSLTPATVTTATPNSPTFAGIISGAISFEKHGLGTQVLTGVSTYTGKTTIKGGTISLRDEGQLQNTSELDISNGNLTIDNSGATTTGSFSLARLPGNIAASLFGGSFVFQGGGTGDYLATLLTSVLRLKGGANTVSANAGAGGTSTFTLGSLVRDDVLSTVNFTGSGLGNTSGFISKISFNPASEPVLTNNIIGPWAIVNGGDYASYNSGTNSIGGLSNTGGGFVGYSGVLNTGVPANNVSLGSNVTVGSVNVNVFRSTGTAVVTQTAGTTLTLGNGVSGGFLANSTLTIGSTVNEGNLTSAGSQLFAYINSNSTVNSSIIDGAGALTLVKSGGSALTLTGANAYTGGTVVAQGTLTLSNTTANPATANVPIPGNLTIMNGSVVGMSQPGQLRDSAVVTIDGAGTLNFNTTNTINSVVFNNRGGNANPVVNASNVLTLSSATPITAANQSLSTTPVVAGTSLVLSNAAPTISTTGDAATHLLITAPIHQAGGVIAKSGDGLLALNPNVTITGNGVTNSDLILNLSDLGLAIGMTVTGPGVPAGTRITDLQNVGGGQIQVSAPLTATTTAGNFVFSGSTVSTGFKVNANGGGIVLGSSSVVDPNNSSTILNGPVGTGDLTLESNGAILSDGTIRTLHNNVIVPADFVIGTPNGSLTRALPGNAVNFTGNIVLANNLAHTATVNGLTNTSTISGNLVGIGAPFNKAGEGTLVLSAPTNGTTFDGTFGVTGGVLRSGASGAIPAGAQVMVGSGGALDIAGFDQTLSKLTGTGVVGSSSGSFTTLTIGVPKPTDVDQAPSSTFGGSIAGVAENPLNPVVLNLTKEGAGTFTLTGKNFISGEATVNTGVLAVAVGGELQVKQSLTVNAGSKLEVNGRISGTVSSGNLLASGLGATVTGYGIIDVNTLIGADSIISPTTDPTRSLTFTDHALDISDDATLVYTARQSLTGAIKFTGSFGQLTLPTNAGWTLKLQNLDIVNPTGMKFVLFDGVTGGTRLNGNSDFSDDFGTVANIDFGTTGWSINTNAAEFGVHYDTALNDIYLTGVIPEPSTGLLLLSALGSALGFRRMRRRN